MTVMSKIEPPVLAVRDLSISYGPLQAVRGVSFSIAPGEAMGLIGESGSGKSSVAYAVMRYIKGQASGEVHVAGQDVMALSEQALGKLRGRTAAMVYQDPMSALNPAIKVGEQIAEAIRLHGRIGKALAWKRGVALLERVHLPRPAEIAHRYPHQLSGGQQQRVVIAMALACDPQLLIMDEPTTGLDVTTEAVILDLVNELRRETGVAVLFISHNMGVVAQVCDRVGVLYAGQLIEEGTTEQVLRQPRHPYTVALMRAMPAIDGPRRRLAAIPGRLPDLRSPPPGCIFTPRCAMATAECESRMPDLANSSGGGHRSRCHYRDEVALRLPPEPLVAEVQLVEARQERPRLQIIAVSKQFRARPALPFMRGPAPVRAVDDVTLDIPPGRTLAVVGESGSGKSTLARCVAGLIVPEDGAIRLENEVLDPLVQKRGRAAQQAVQFVFQNPDAALNPHWTVAEIVGRPMRLYGGQGEGKALRHRIIEQLEAVKLGERYLDLYPREMSGGEKQRVSIARAFAGRPRLVICDEPTSALDISVQAAILNELLALQRENGTSYLFISHDLGVVRHVAHEVAIMRHGRIVESGPPAAVFGDPREEYTRNLIAAIPTLERREAAPALLTA
ncbi:ABC transporter ATP-binding protein [Roseomonas aerophila]|uniref:ABC transporter ATP-binding protein n=1 Tax=Teichococcus aerophilus TaxID=1224513 RepID=A0ABR7RF93_9PROT|nr:ABC transporter ATP-binding protein [Pseudoroseomonas aerophila]MBC9205235.1 ABC transporter ATP-binding protein [Pseudoroseomonas aerophila]